jgi:hypothetical protein
VRGVVPLLAFAAGAAAASAVAASAPPDLRDTSRGKTPFVESWADTQHGWRLAGRPDLARFYPAVEATDDGGRTWRRVLTRRDGIARIGRVSPTTGYAWAGRSPHGALVPSGTVLVTSDGGRRWRALRISPRPQLVEASGNDLYFVSGHRGGGTPRDVWRLATALSGRPVRMLVGTLLTIVSLQPVPGGIAALGLGAPAGSPFSVLVSRLGRTRVVSVPAAPGPNREPCNPVVFAVEWPVITIVAKQSFTPHGNPCESGMSRSLAWVSTDAGGSWWIGGPNLFG